MDANWIEIIQSGVSETMIYEDITKRMRNLFSRMSKDERGAAIIYFTVFAGVLIGFVGMAVDFGRINMTHSQASAAADAAALAAASQLDGSGTAITRALDASFNTPLIVNNQNYAQSIDPGRVITMTNIRFLFDLPPNDTDPITAIYETTDPFEARFVEVTTEQLIHQNFFLTAIGADPTALSSATAVAGFKQVVCRVSPLMICNPNEAAPPDGQGIGANFNVGDWRGRQVLAKTQGAGASWAPGVFGLLKTDSGNGAKAIAEEIASANGPNQCFGSKVDIKPGSTESTRTSFNVAFDIYENPFFGGNASADLEFRPAKNVVKGRVPIPSGNVCKKNEFTEPGPMTATKMGRDSNMDPAATNSASPRFGNGLWNCLEYWAVNHPDSVGDPAPTGCEGPGIKGMSRYDIYRHEIDTDNIPNNFSGDPLNPGGEDGNPQCYSDPLPADDKDRRILFMAVVNCQEHDIHGSEVDVPVINFLKLFITEPVGDESVPGANDSDFYLEIVDVVSPGADDGILHDIVQLYR